MYMIPGTKCPSSFEIVKNPNLHLYQVEQMRLVHEEIEICSVETHFVLLGMCTW